VQNGITYIRPLDGIRAIAAMMVMFFHFFQNDHFSGNALLWIQKLSFWGQTGVSLFFVLSGFLITRILLHSKGDAHYFKNFFIRRSLRIFPLYFFYLILFYYLSPLLIHTRWSEFSDQWYYWFYLQDFSLTFHWPAFGPMHFWSLAIEEHFYLFWPLLVYFIPNRHLTKVILLLLLIAPICRYILASHQYETFYFTFARMDELALGAWLALLEQEGKLTVALKNYFLSALILVGALTVFLWTQFFGEKALWIQVVKYDLIAIIYFLVIGLILIIPASNIVSRLLSHRIMVFIGSISYGLYVYHAITFPVVKRSFLSAYSLPVQFIAAYLFSFLVAWLSYIVMEKPIMSLKKKFQYS
jgi:peptidoglycan/LPS O-acetylase OafA/YrhL